MEKGLYELKMKILRSTEMSETFKRELANDIFELEQQTKESEERRICSCGSILVKTTGGYRCGNYKCSV